MQHTLIIAEAGVNHNGSIEIAKQLIEAAAQAGADFVKFQTFKAGSLVSKSARKADYQKANIGDGDDSQFSMLKKLELTEANHYELIEHCIKWDIQFLSTGFDIDSIDFLEKLNIPFYKIPSGEITNKPYLKHIASRKKPVIMSTGMANMDEINDALSVLIDNGVPKDQITVLHCNTEYPTSMEDVNLKAMEYMREALGVKVGYSDHTNGIEVPVAAVALGACVIEKHFTLDRNMEGPDHKASLEPAELKQMVDAIRNIEKAISGSGIKEPGPGEIKNIAVARKSIVAARDIRKGEIFSEENLTVKRPGNGISPMKWDDVIGLISSRDFKLDELIEI
ncbi:MAG: N-acetylneuraminate synthase [Bacteroidetes bacterium GWF2_43_63]|nr:MAG: N-acetylneuraminate synthase [Bacteroidetes bacterium GWE2_42_42]OFY56050.1 MAG: N-acetylneuraminate synthase [Bacteroidetes bacterium GWF2_43_63]HBG70702.1 N-acetylneuraminate synthase [Bacteroidales bacterium]HCB62470.1 N-acetylneuraminate synthase [Bacteroidales bacterium]HCY21925.1 N-acetylneuraminate synthase [Bacteroidales bacterium]